MKNTTKRDLLLKEINFNHSGFCPPATISAFIDQLKSGEDKCFTLGTTANFLFDIIDDKFLYMDKDIYEITGYTTDEIYRGNMIDFISAIITTEHAADLSYFAKLSYDVFGLKSASENISINVEYNFITKKGKEKRMLVQYRTVFWNDEGKPLLNLGQFTDVTSSSEMKAPWMKVIRNNRLIYFEKRTNGNTAQFGLSKKEMEIISLISRGMSNQEVADNLNTSISTVYTHRRNIKRKTNTPISGIIKKLIEKGSI